MRRRNQKKPGPPKSGFLKTPPAEVPAPVQVTAELEPEPERKQPVGEILALGGMAQALRTGPLSDSRKN
jgi:hypothetical protein